MTLAAVGTIDWTPGWWDPWREPGMALAAAVRHEGSVASALNACAGRTVPVASAPPVRFVPQSELPAGTAYEAHIFETGTVPTRDNLHDFFNGLVWLRLPQAKRRMNALQAAEIARAGIGARRGPLRDALTLLDESGAVLDAPAPLWEALLARDWRRLFVTLRPRWREARLLLVGHALLEKLVFPRKAVTAHVWRGSIAIDSIARADAALAAALRPEVLVDKPFTPLPVLGVPGWWAENERASFYDDPRVFRPRRLSQEQRTTETPADGPA